MTDLETKIANSSIMSTGLSPADFQNICVKIKAAKMNCDDIVFKFNFIVDSWEVFDLNDMETPITSAKDNWK